MWQIAVQVWMKSLYSWFLLYSERIPITTQGWMFFKSVQKKFNRSSFWFGDHKDRLFSFIAVEKVTILKYVCVWGCKGAKEKKDKCFLHLTDVPFISLKERVA